MIERPDIGSIQFYLKKWGVVDDSGKEEFRFERLPTKLCAPDAFNDVDGSNVASVFYPTNPLSEKDLKNYGSKLKCLDLDHPDAPDSLEILGNFNTEKASNLMIVFERCDIRVEDNDCASDEVFKNWIEQKYIVSLINEKKFVKNKIKGSCLNAYVIRCDTM